MTSRQIERAIIILLSLMLIMSNLRDLGPSVDRQFIYIAFKIAACSWAIAYYAWLVAKGERG